MDESKLSAVPKFAEVIAQIEASLKGAVVVCHNAKFEIQFIDNEFRKRGRTVEIANLIESLLLAREFYELPS